MTMDELRRQLTTIKWPISLRVDSKDIHVASPEELVVPPVGNLICAFHDGAFAVIDCGHIATITRVKSNARRRQAG